MAAYDDLKWITEKEIDRLPEVYQTLAHDIGLGGMRIFIARYQGTPLYLPKIDDLLSEIRNRKIRDEFNGHNHNALAIKYGLTSRWIYEIISNTPQDSNQITLF